MLKISQVGPATESVTLCLEGRVIGPWVSELNKACDQLLDRAETVKLNLADVEFIDRQGVALFAVLQSRGVALENCSPFLREQLKSTG